MRPPAGGLVIGSVRKVPGAMWKCQVSVIFGGVSPSPAAPGPFRADGERPPSYDGRRFRLTLNGGMPAPCDVVLECRQDGEVVMGSYRGDVFEHGALLAIVRAMGCLEGRFQHLNGRRRIETGRCWATPQRTSAGRMRLYIEWRMSGQEGVAVMEEA